MPKQCSATHKFYYLEQRFGSIWMIIFLLNLNLENSTIRNSITVLLVLIQI
jgi:hypothetical protein